MHGRTVLLHTEQGLGDTLQFIRYGFMPNRLSYCGPVGDNRTLLRFEERYHLTKLPWRWFEGPIYRFINKQNEASMRRLSAWLTEHPEYRADLVHGSLTS